MTRAGLLSSEIGRALSASLIFAALFVAASAAVATTWTDLSTAIEERDATSELLTRSVEAGRRAGLAAGAKQTIDPFVAAESETLAAAAVDSLVRSTVADAGSSLQSSRAEAKPPEGGLSGRIEAQAIIDGSNDALQAVLLKLERGQPLMLVDDLSIVPADEPGDPRAPQLRMTVTFSAYWRNSSSP